MKISCQMCEAKYTIADEKISGKIVKIKCKKCGSTIVVNGNEAGVSAGSGADPNLVAQHEGDDDGETRVANSEPVPPPGADEWTVNVSDEDQRTMTSAQLVAERRRGTITDDTFVWKDGMADWLPISSVPEIVQLLAAPAQSSPPRPKSSFPTPAPSPNVGLGGTAIMGDEPRAGGFPAPAAARRAGNRPQVDLFGGANGSSDAPPPAATYPSGSGQVGERNENSVLFSLSALTAAESAAKAGKKGDDAVIDMMGPSHGPKNNGRAGFDDIMNLGGGGFGASPALAPPPLLAPVIEPPPPPPPPPTSVPSQMPGPMMGMQNPYMMMAPPKRSPIGIIIGIALGLALVGGIAIFALRGKPAETPTATNDTNTTTPASPPTTTAVAQAPTATEAKDPEAPPTTTGSTPSESTTATAKPTGAPLGGPIGGPGPGPKPDKTAAPEKTAAPVEKPTEKPTEPPPSEGGREFNRGAASAALGAAAGGARACKKPDGPTGTGRVRVTFAPSGNVTQSAVQGAPFAGTSVGGCVAAAFRSARVPPFDGSSVSVTKSFSIN